MLDKIREECAEREFREFAFSKRYDDSLSDFLLKIWKESRDLDSQYEEALRKIEELESEISDLQKEINNLEDK